MKITTRKAVSVGLMMLVLWGVEASFATEADSAPAEKTFNAPHGLKVSIKMVGPYTEPADLQIITLFKHKASGDTYQGAAKEGLRPEAIEALLFLQGVERLPSLNAPINDFRRSNYLSVG
jgi:hypothetical protein